MTDTLKYEREDGTIADVPFGEAYAYGAIRDVIRLTDGSIGRRVKAPKAEVVQELEKPIISDALGFIAEQLPDFELDRSKNGFSDVSFVPDPKVPGFMQVRCGSVKSWRRYMKHRGYADRNSSNGGGATVTAKQLADLRAKMLEKYPSQEKENFSVLT